MLEQSTPLLEPEVHLIGPQGARPPSPKGKCGKRKEIPFSVESWGGKKV